MPLDTYLNQYSESLRKLTALGNSQSQPQPQNMGGADQMGAAPQPGAALGAGPAAPPAGALGTPPSTPAPAGALAGAGPPPSAAANKPGGKPVGFADVMDGSTTAEKEDALKNLEKHVDVNDEFSALQEHNIIPADAKMSRHDKGMLVMEFGLRMMSASAQGADAAGAAGIAGQGLLESYRAKKEAAQKDAERKTERAQDRADKSTESAIRSRDVQTEMKSREGISAGDNASRERVSAASDASSERRNELDAKTRMSEARIRAKETNRPVMFTAADGNIRQMDADGNVTTPTEEVTDKAGKKSRIPVKPLQRATTDAFDPKEFNAAVQKAMDAMDKNLKLKSQLRGQNMDAGQIQAEIEKRARAQVRASMPVDPGSSNPLHLDLGD